MLDVKERYWRLHLRGAGVTPSPEVPDRRDLLWNLRRDGADDAEVHRRLSVERPLEEYLRVQMAEIETPRFLRYDRPWPWSAPVLRALRARYRTGLITMRRNRAALEQELAETGLRPLLDGISSRADFPEGPAQSKADLVRHLEATERLPVVAVVGDTEIDVRSARELGLPAIVVACGMTSRRRLERLEPDHVLDDLTGLFALLGMA
ncbi:MAG: HAD family hydrolase [Gemmatimonadetes bacterium]|nr:HAD family hydrolase [Gemmatimonadota bacterium]